MAEKRRTMLIETSPQTDASRVIAAELERLLPEGGRWRAGALFLTYDDPMSTDPHDCRTGTGIYVRVKDVERGAAHLSGLLRALRQTADQIEQRAQERVDALNREGK